MKYNRVIIAKVALGVASEDEVFWVQRCGKENVECETALNELRELAKLPSSYGCMDTAALIEAGDTNRVAEHDHDHLMGCNRCARIGQYIANMPFPSAAPQLRPLSLSA